MENARVLICTLVRFIGDKQYVRLGLEMPDDRLGESYVDSTCPTLPSAQVVLQVM